LGPIPPPSRGTPSLPVETTIYDRNRRRHGLIIGLTAGLIYGLIANVANPLLLWGIDELLTYHYLVAEVFRYLDVPYEKFWALSKAQQAEFERAEEFSLEDDLVEIGQLPADPHALPQRSGQRG